MTPFAVLVIPVAAKTVDDCYRETITNSVSQLQGIVGGYFQVINIPATDNATMWVNEEGLIHDLPVNAFATTILAHYAGQVGQGLAQMIRGTVCVSGYDPDGGETDVPDTFVGQLLLNFPREGF